jgi:hypothetical protein
MYIRRSATLNFRDGKDRNSWDTHFRVNKGNILHKTYINILAYYYLMFTGMINPLKHKEMPFLKV